jgi:hypothetical protein
VFDGAKRFKEEKWDSWSLIMGWPVQSIWPKLSDGDDINAV